MAIISFLLIGTENIGAQIEEPFRILPLEAICRAIENNLRELEEQYDLGGTSDLADVLQVGSKANGVQPPSGQGMTPHVHFTGSRSYREAGGAEGG
mmetsp:Transcript_32600/g.71991  ORF Transcript_32600/g.71991 Transcript_32600/m.71991 type:complete len:96 (+) Transcript_32600:3-290(+)